LTLPLIHSLPLEALTSACKEAGYPAFRAKQIWHWLYVRRVSSWDAMRNIPQDVRTWLDSAFDLHSADLIRSEGAPGQTRKLLVGLRDGDAVEAVLLPAREQRNTVCISCQVGCRFKCAFCASGQAGFRRNLEAGEMAGQVLVAARELDTRPSNIVFMGMGEPFDNYDAVLETARILNHPGGLGIGARRITVSTSGVIPGIERFAKEPEQFELSVSLHAPNAAIRSRLMPIERHAPLLDLVDACRQYTRVTNRIVTFEYTLIRDINDKLSHAHELVALLRDFPCRVNLIPLSPIAEFDGEASSPEAARQFIDVLDAAHINATLRHSQGASIKAACGQLRFSGRTESDHE